MRLLPLVAVPLVVLALGSGPPARASAGHDGCAGFIDAVPFQITTPGTWCMRSNLVLTDANAQAAVSVQTSGVTMECNGFRLSGAAGGIVAEWGIANFQYSNLTIRGCDVRNFQIPIYVRGDHLIIEDNRVYAGRSRGIFVAGAHNIVRRNIVLETGRDTQFIGWAMGISVFGEVDVIDNTISGVFATNGSDERAYGIFVNWENAADDTQTVIGNRVRNVVPDGTGYGSGIEMAGSGHAVIRDNIVVAPAVDTGISCPYAVGTHLAGNIVLGSLYPFGICPNVSHDNIGKN